MVKIEMIEENGLHIVHISGRIDGMTASEVQRNLEDIILQGQRNVIIDLKEVNYLSSAGLRVFLIAQKQVKKISGKIVLFQVPENVFKIFKMSGFTDIFDVCSSREDVEHLLRKDISKAMMTDQEIDGIQIRYIHKQGHKGKLQLTGKQNKLQDSAFSAQDVISVKPSDFQFATGLATIGEQYDDYKHFFGEAMILNRSIFFYPAVKRPAVDFMLNIEESSDINYKFFHGFGFSGPYTYLLSFEKKEGFLELTHLIDIALNLSEAERVGIVFIAESKGVWGMNLKSVPILENRPQNRKDIFDSENFPEWINFPVEPGDVNCIIAGVGIAIRHPEQANADMASLVSQNSNFHVHGGIFSKGPVSKKIEGFADELKRIISELEISKVQHLLGRSLFSSGLAAIIELEE